MTARKSYDVLQKPGSLAPGEWYILQSKRGDEEWEEHFGSYPTIADQPGPLVARCLKEIEKHFKLCSHPDVNLPAKLCYQYRVIKISVSVVYPEQPKPIKANGNGQQLELL